MKVTSVQMQTGSSAPKKSTQKQAASHAQVSIPYSLEGLNQKGIMFKSSSVDCDCQILTTTEEKLENELRLSKMARNLGVSTPKISPDRTYLIHGQRANYPNAPITKGHIKNVLANILTLDENKIYHGDIEHGHVFYSKNSPNVEFDCFKFGCIFDENEQAKGWMSWEFPATMYPSNIMQFENNCLGHYLSQMDSEDEKNEFLRTYLKEASSFHNSRANHLIDIGAPLEQVNYEKTKSKAYKNPQNSTIELFKDRIEFKNMERRAFTKVDEGKGACGHPKDETLVIEGLFDYLDTMQVTIEYLDKIREMKSKPDIASEQYSYLKGEESYASYWFSHYIQSVSGNAVWALNPENEDNKTHRNISKAERDELNKMFSLLEKTNGTEEQSEIISEIRSYYSKLVNKK